MLQRLGKRILIGAVALWVLFVAGRGLYLASLSPEEHVHRRLSEMVQGFNETDLSACLSGLAPELSVEPRGVSRSKLRGGLSALFLRENDPVAKRFAYRLEMPAEELHVTLDPTDDERAQVELVVHLDHSVNAEWSRMWVVRVEGEMLDDAERGWVFAAAAAETVEGRPPSY